MLGEYNKIIVNFTKFKRRIKKWLQRHKNVLRSAGIVFAGLAFILYTIAMADSQRSVDMATMRPLLNIIAKAESNGNYNAYFGNASNNSIKLSEMPIHKVMQWQESYIEKGNASSAVGRYQIIDSTLAGLVEQLNLDKRQSFNRATQDKLAVALIERRGATDYVNKNLSAEEFAANLAKEWAGLPKTLGKYPDRSYYAGDGLNKSQVEIKSVLAAIDKIKPLTH